ncbi:hypothetical protein HDU96_008741 [Phlyctochytrium bullatum]|nr:hypothetical protein HDU96_008741 [Phlyctochytrium bullatum]
MADSTQEQQSSEDVPPDDPDDPPAVQVKLEPYFSLERATEEEEQFLEMLYGGMQQDSIPMSTSELAQAVAVDQDATALKPPSPDLAARPTDSTKQPLLMPLLPRTEVAHAALVHSAVKDHPTLREKSPSCRNAKRKCDGSHPHCRRFVPKSLESSSEHVNAAHTTASVASRSDLSLAEQVMHSALLTSRRRGSSASSSSSAKARKFGTPSPSVGSEGLPWLAGDLSLPGTAEEIMGAGAISLGTDMDASPIPSQGLPINIFEGFQSESSAAGGWVAGGVPLFSHTATEAGLDARGTQMTDWPYDEMLMELLEAGAESAGRSTPDSALHGSFAFEERETLDQGLLSGLQLPQTTEEGSSSRSSSRKASGSASKRRGSRTRPALLPKPKIPKIADEPLVHPTERGSRLFEEKSMFCRSKKRKCDGKHPSCHRYQQRLSGMAERSVSTGSTASLSAQPTQPEPQLSTDVFSFDLPDHLTSNRIAGLPSAETYWQDPFSSLPSSVPTSPAAAWIRVPSPARSLPAAWEPSPTLGVAALGLGLWQAGTDATGMEVASRASNQVQLQLGRTLGNVLTEESGETGLDPGSFLGDLIGHEEKPATVEDDTDHFSAAE